MIAAVLCAVMLPAAASAYQSSPLDIAGYTIRSNNDIFKRELEEAIADATEISKMPVLDCSVEYIRRSEDNSIVYRRGPFILEQRSPMKELELTLARTQRPASEFDYSQRSYFVGGIVADLPKPGETGMYITPAGDDFQYMTRIAIVPDGYENAKLTGKVLIERSVVQVHGEFIDVYESEVFSRSVSLSGDEPLHFSLPEWEVIGSTKPFEYLPPSLNEDLMVTLDLPQHFGLSRNYPNPFLDRTRLTYALPKPANVQLAVNTPDGKIMIDEGWKEAGVHHVVWDAEEQPDGEFTTELKATSADGEMLRDVKMELQKDPGGYQFPIAYDPPTAFEQFTQRVRLSSEYGVQLLYPFDSDKPYRDIISHFVLRVGYQFTNEIEAGIVVGKETFNREPEGLEQPVLDGREMSWGTYEYAGPYIRTTQKIFGIRTIALASIGFSKSDPLSELGFGFQAEVFPQIDLMLVPSVMNLWRTTISTNIGLHYGVKIRF